MSNSEKYPIGSLWINDKGIIMKVVTQEEFFECWKYSTSGGEAAFIKFLPGQDQGEKVYKLMPHRASAYKPYILKEQQKTELPPTMGYMELLK